MMVFLSTARSPEGEWFNADRLLRINTDTKGDTQILLDLGAGRNEIIKLVGYRAGAAKAINEQLKSGIAYGTED